MARFRLESEIKLGWYWEKEERKECRLCYAKEETWEYIWEECRDWQLGGEKVGWRRWVLGEEGEGEAWMRRVEKERRDLEERQRGGREKEGREAGERGRKGDGEGRS